MARTRLEQYEGIAIVFIDFSGTVEENRAAMKEAAPLIRNRPPKSVCSLTYTDQGKFDGKVVEELKAFVKENEPYVVAAAVVGVKGLQKIVLDAVSLFSSRDFATFEEVEPARQYLVRKAGEAAKE